jgi:hypothetical protein
MKDLSGVGRQLMTIADGMQRGEDPQRGVAAAKKILDKHGVASELMSRYGSSHTTNELAGPFGKIRSGNTSNVTVAHAVTALHHVALQCR